MSDLKFVATPLHARLPSSQDAEPVVVRLTKNLDEPNRSSHALLWEADAVGLPPGFAVYFTNEDVLHESQVCKDGLSYVLPKDLAYLEEGDIVRVNPRGAEIWVMYRRASRFNSILLTERCNSWCVMCSQPPRASEDEELLRAWLDAISLMSPETTALGFTGGEPTLLADRFLDLVSRCKSHLPATALHVLSNGRLFNYLSFAQALGELAHPDLILGIPLYSDLAWQHDFIVQAPHAFDQTIRGILNLARCHVRVEVRVVIHRYSVDRLPQLATFIARNLPFVDHVALMGLEPIGFAKSNLQALWIDPVDYQEILDAAVGNLTAHGMSVSIYNHQLCILPTRLWPFARQSISDWKNVYLATCQSCAVRDQCGGFFHSAARAHSRAIKPFDRAPTGFADST